MEDMQFSESQTRIRWTDELVGILNSNTSTPDEKNRARRLLPRFASVDRVDALEALLATSENVRAMLLVFDKPGLEIREQPFSDLVDSLLRGAPVWACDWVCASLLRVGEKAAHHEHVERAVKGLDPRSLRGILDVRGDGVGSAGRAFIYQELIARDCLDAPLAWKTLDFEPSVEMALADRIRTKRPLCRNNAFLERLRVENPEAFAEALASFSLPVDWLLRYGSWPRLADQAERLLLEPRYSPQVSFAAEVLAAAPNAAARMDVLLKSGRLESSAKYDVTTGRLNLLPVDPKLVEHAHAWRMENSNGPMELVRQACLNADPIVQAHGVQALFARCGERASPELLIPAMVSGGLARTIALRVPAAKGDEDAIAELVAHATLDEEHLVHAEALRSLRLAGVPTSRFLRKALKGLERLETDVEAAPVASEAAHALWKAEGLSPEETIRALADAVKRRVPWPTWCDIDAAIGSWLGDEPDPNNNRRQRAFF